MSLTNYIVIIIIDLGVIFFGASHFLEKKKLKIPNYCFKQSYIAVYIKQRNKCI